MEGKLGGGLGRAARARYIRHVCAANAVRLYSIYAVNNTLNAHIHARGRLSLLN